MPFKPINLGNIIAQGEAIQGSRLNNLKLAQSMDPNSPQNQLLRAKIAEAERSALTGGIDPTSNMRDIQFLRDMESQGYSPEQVDLMKQAIAKSNAWLSPAAVTNAAQAGQTIKGSESMGSTQAELLANEGKSSYDPYGLQSIPKTQIDSSLGGLAVSTMPTKAAQQGEIKKAEQTATNEANLDPMTGQAPIESAKTTAKGQAQRGQEWINKATEAAEAYPIIGRALQLLDTVETGGIDNAKLMASNFFGVTGADEAELSNNLGKAVLKQLKSTFGAAFTVEEGRRLEQIEANYGKSTEGNKRLLQQAQKILNDAMKRGLSAARGTGDAAAIDVINRGYTFDLSMPNVEPGQDDDPLGIFQ